MLCFQYALFRLLTLSRQFLESQEGLAIRITNHEFRPGQIEANAKAGAEKVVYLTDPAQNASASTVADQPISVRIVKVVFLDTVILIERQLVGHLSNRVTRREHLKDDGQGYIAFYPLHIRTTVALGTPEDNVNVGGNHDIRTPLHGIPELIAADKHIDLVAEESRQVPRKRNNPAELAGIFCHGHPIRFRIQDWLGRVGHSRLYHVNTSPTTKLNPNQSSENRSAAMIASAISVVVAVPPRSCVKARRSVSTRLHGRGDALGARPVSGVEQVDGRQQQRQRIGPVRRRCPRGAAVERFVDTHAVADVDAVRRR